MVITDDCRQWPRILSFAGMNFSTDFIGNPTLQNVSFSGGCYLVPGDGEWHPGLGLLAYLVVERNDSQ